MEFSGDTHSIDGSYGWLPVTSAAVAPYERNAVLSRIARTGVLALVAIVWFGNIGYRNLAEPDEARYAEIAREMLVTGDWVTPRLNGIPYFEKPPLQYWATATAYAAFGTSVWAARLWVTCLGLLGIVIAYFTARTLWDRRTGEYAAWIMASFPLYFVVAHLNILDAGLAFFMNAGVCAFLLAQRASSPGAQRRWMAACWTALSLGFLQKGLVALALPGIALVAYSALYRQWRLWRELHLLDALAILAVIALPWVILAAHRNPGFLQFFFVHEHFDRFVTTIHKRYEPWWYFIAILSVGVLPWLVPVARAAWHTARTRQASTTLSAERLLLVWAAAQLLFFSLSDSKLAPYIVPMAMPLAMLSARWLQMQGSHAPLRSAAATSLVFMMLLISLRWLLPHFVSNPDKLASFLQVAVWAQAAGLAGIACLAVYLMSALRDDLDRAIPALAASMSIALAIVMSGGNALEPLRDSPRLARVIGPHLAQETSLYCVGTYPQRLPFLLERTCTVVAYLGEFELQFDPQQRQHLPDLPAFLDRWQNDPHAVAIVKADLWPAIAASNIPARVLLRDDRTVVMVKP